MIQLPWTNDAEWRRVLEFLVNGWVIHGFDGKGNVWLREEGGQ